MKRACNLAFEETREDDIETRTLHHIDFSVTELNSATTMNSGKPYSHPNPLLSLSTAVHHHCHRLVTEIATRFEDVKRLTSNWPSPPALRRVRPTPPPLFAWIGQTKPALAAAIYTKRCFTGTSLFTVSNTDNEFVLISDPDGTKSIGLLCFREVDALAFLAQAKMRKRELKCDAKVVPISLEEVYNLKVEGIAFRFLPEPRQIKHALEIKAADGRSGFDGVPVFQSDLLVVKMGRRQRYCPVYFRKEDLERDLSLSNISKPSKGRNASHIVVGSLEDILKKIETSEKNSGWEDLVFIPPGASQAEHLKKVTGA